MEKSEITQIQDFPKGAKIEITTRSHGLIHRFQVIILKTIFNQWQGSNRSVKVKIVDEEHPASAQRIMTVGGGTSAKKFKNTI